MNIGAKKFTIPQKKRSANLVRIAFVGDLVGKPGVNAIEIGTPFLKHAFGADAVIVNAENAADGSGLRVAQYKKLNECGVDAITLGDHVYKRREIIPILNNERNIVRPANFPARAAGRGSCVIELEDQTKIAVACFLGRTFTRPVDCPFESANQTLAEIPSQIKIRFVDFHTEATSEIQLMGRFLDGRVSAVLGTHTHVATADEQIFPGGTAFQCDVGMTGPHESIIGRKIAPVLENAISFEPTTFHVATGNILMNGTWFDVDKKTGSAVNISRFCIDFETLSQWKQENPQLLSSKE